ncbi:TPA: hypothetical protein ACLFZ1_001438 [Serratia marcescens]|uniref:hypothetical protein n=2 Tax=Serratia TaxID=613 RepID=UPI0012AB55ED|nr:MULTISPECIES: hypothetical protein [Serratia]NGD66442.1 hypothetical protein [Serratia marcescens]WRV75844.1 hypothetical protein VOT21_19480 [Serratia sp. K-M0252]HBC5194008.1 hypothetical protein [Serratia marcescens]
MNYNHGHKIGLWCVFVYIVSLIEINVVIVAINETIITVSIYSWGCFMAVSVKPVLLSEKQMQAIRMIQEEQRKKSGIGVAPSLHEIARGLMDKALSGAV